MILSLAFLGLTSEVRNLRMIMPEISGEFNQDTLGQIVCIFHSAKGL